MSVYAFVQSPKNDGTVLFVKDGQYIEASEKDINKIENYFHLAYDKKRPTYFKIKNQHVYVDFHKERDESNRRREFLVSWESNDDKEMILNTVNKIGLTDEFDYQYITKKVFRKNIIFGMVSLLIIILLYKYLI